MEEITAKFGRRDDMLDFLNDWRLKRWVHDDEIRVSHNKKDMSVTIRFIQSYYDATTFQAVTDLLYYYAYFN